MGDGTEPFRYRRREKPTKAQLEQAHDLVQYLADPPAERPCFLNEVASVLRFFQKKRTSIAPPLEEILHTLKVVNDEVHIFERVEPVYGGEQGAEERPKAYRYKQVMAPPQARAAIDNYIAAHFARGRRLPAGLEIKSLYAFG